MIDNYKREDLFKLFITMMLFCLAITFFYKLHCENIKCIDVSGYDTSKSCEFCIDNVDFSCGFVDIRGWIMKPNDDIKFFKSHVLIKDIQKDIYYLLPTNMAERADVTLYFNDGCNYDNSGFHSKLKTSKIGVLQNGRYLICLLYENNGEKLFVNTNIFLNNKGDN